MNKKIPSIVDAQKIISKLTPEDRKLLMMDLSSRHSEESGHHPDVVILYEAMRDLLKDRNHPSPPFTVFEQGWNQKDNVKRLKKMDQILHWIDSTFNPQDANERNLAIRFSLYFLVVWMEDRGIPLSIQSMCDNCLHIPSQIEKAFPGACQSGVLPYICGRFMQTVLV